MLETRVWIKILFPFNLPNFMQFWHRHPNGHYWHPPWFNVVTFNGLFALERPVLSVQHHLICVYKVHKRHFDSNYNNYCYFFFFSFFRLVFLDGWWGIVFNANISSVSDYLAIGLMTSYLRSLTTFSSWNQKIIDLIVDGHWVLVVLGFLVGENPYCKNYVDVAIRGGKWVGWIINALGV